jgi:hypothetical protein
MAILSPLAFIAVMAGTVILRRVVSGGVVISTRFAG